MLCLIIDSFNFLFFKLNFRDDDVDENFFLVTNCNQFQRKNFLIDGTSLPLNQAREKKRS